MLGRNILFCPHFSPLSAVDIKLYFQQWSFVTEVAKKGKLLPKFRWSITQSEFLSFKYLNKGLRNKHLIQTLSYMIKPPTLNLDQKCCQNILLLQIFIYNFC